MPTPFSLLASHSIKRALVVTRHIAFARLARKLNRIKLSLLRAFTSLTAFSRLHNLTIHRLRPKGFWIRLHKAILL
jgi:hypothetical protein